MLTIERGTIRGLLAGDGTWIEMRQYDGCVGDESHLRPTGREAEAPGRQVKRYVQFTRPHVETTLTYPNAFMNDGELDPEGYWRYRIVYEFEQLTLECILPSKAEWSPPLQGELEDPGSGSRIQHPHVWEERENWARLVLVKPVRLNLYELRWRLPWHAARTKPE